MLVLLDLKHSFDRRRYFYILKGSEHEIFTINQIYLKKTKGKKVSPPPPCCPITETSNASLPATLNTFSDA